MRYLFRGLIRDTGRPVEGHVEADTEEAAFSALSDNGIVTESLRPDPKPQTLSQPAGGGQFADALESAFDTSSTQVPFDDLSDRYRGKRVWVIDRDKIRRRVAQVVDQAIQTAQSTQQGDAAIRETVAKAIEGMFNDNRNLTSPANQVAAQNAAAGGAGSPALQAQVTRIEQLVRQAENVLSQISSLARSGGFGGGGPVRRRRASQTEKNEEQNAVLLEIFKSNLDLRRSMEGGLVGPAAQDAPANSTEQPSSTP